MQFSVKKQIDMFKLKRANKPKKASSGKISEFLNRLSAGLVTPVSILPIAGLALGIGSLIVSQSHGNEALAIFGNIFVIPGNLIFAALPLFFGVAVAIAFTEDAGMAGFATVVGWLVFIGVQSAFISPNHFDNGEIQSYSYMFYNFTTAQYNSIFTTLFGIQTLNSSVFGGIVIGLVTAFLYNKYKNIQLPAAIGLFSGKRFIPIITFVSSLLIGILFAIVWPGIGYGLYYLGIGLTSIPLGFGGLFYGFINRCLMPFGLHHIINTSLWFSGVGGTFNPGSLAVLGTYSGIGLIPGGDYAYYVITAAGSTDALTWTEVMQMLGIANSSTVVNGDINITLALTQLVGNGIPTNSLFEIHAYDLTSKSVGAISENVSSITFDMIGLGTATSAGGTVAFNAGQYTSGFYPLFLFGCPAVALAIIMAAPKGDDRQVAFGIVFSAALTSCLTGVAEPLEFTFLFLAPVLFFGVYAFLCGIGVWLTTMLGAHIGFSFSAGLLDFCVYGVPYDIVGAGANVWIPLVIGACLFPVFFFSFWFLIKKLNVKTPGRGGQLKLASKKDYKKSQSSGSKEDKNAEIRELAIEVIKAYGGLENIRNVNACITKLRIQTEDPKKVDEQKLLQLGAQAVLHPSPATVFAVFGYKADIIKLEIRNIKENIGKDPELQKALIVTAPKPAVKTNGGKK